MDKKEKFANNLKQITKEKNMTQRELARLCELHESAISRYFHATHYPTVERFIKLATVLEVDITELIN